MSGGTDVLVLGAGFAGLGAALALQERGARVVVVDRSGPATETSYGNAGLIQAEAVVPYAFPRRLSVLLGALLDRRTDARLHLRALHRTAPWLLAYAQRSSPAAVARTARANVPLIARAVADHRRLIDRAGAGHLLREGGYLRLFRTQKALEAARREGEKVRETYAVPFDVWDSAALQGREPHLSRALAGAIHHPTPVRTTDPGLLGEAYAQLLRSGGGRVVKGDALTFRRNGAFQVETEEGPVCASDAVVALGPWSDTLLSRFGIKAPLGVKRGYHRHYALKGNAVLNHLAVDEERGVVLSPQDRGLRLTTGAEFAPRDAPHTPVQLAKAEREAGSLLPLGEAVEPGAWRGARPCFPDLLPAVGPVPGVPGLWVSTGHHHLGLTLGPTTGVLLAELMTGATPFTDPAPYALSRFSLS